MNYIKLNELAAQAMGWTAGKMMSREEYSRKEVDVWKAPIGEGYRYFSKWNPCEDLNDASALLDKVAGDKVWLAGRYAKGWPEERRYWVATNAPENPGPYEASSLPLAMTLASLRASGIPESSITEATGD